MIQPTYIVLGFIVLAVCGWVWVRRRRVLPYVPLTVSLARSLRGSPPIPHTIFQTHRSQMFLDQSPTLSAAQSSWSSLADHTYRFFDDTQLRAFMDAFVQRPDLPVATDRMRDAWARCILPVMQADLWRYCVIFAEGGLYVDMDTVCVAPEAVYYYTAPRSWLVTSTEFRLEDVQLCQWAFAAPPRSPVVARILQTVVDRLVSTPVPPVDAVSMRHVLDTTGPVPFTHGVEAYLREQNLPTYARKSQYEAYRNHVIHVYAGRFVQKHVARHLFSGREAHGGWKHSVLDADLWNWHRRLRARFG